MWKCFNCESINDKTDTCVVCGQKRPEVKPVAPPPAPTASAYTTTPPTPTAPVYTTTPPAPTAPVYATTPPTATAPVYTTTPPVSEKKEAPKGKSKAPVVIVILSVIIVALLATIAFLLINGSDKTSYSGDVTSEVTEDNNVAGTGDVNQKEAFEEDAADVVAFAKAAFEDAYSTKDMEIASKDIYEEWDALLDDICGYFEEELPEDEYLEFEEEQDLWKEERDEAAEDAMDENEGSLMAKYNVLITYTRERVYELIEEVE